MRCGGCNRELAPKLKFCPLCGAPTLALPEGVGAQGMDPGNASRAGRPIREWLDECASLGRDLPLATAVGLLLKILDALTILHERGVVHSEPSPENILVRGDPLAGDLRVTLLISPDAPPFDPAIPLPANAEMLGAPAWTAPERRTGPETIGPTADLYAAGSIFYELLLQVPPEGRWELPSAVRGDVPREIDSFLMTAMNTRPDRRFANAELMAAAARRALAAAPRRFGYSPQEREKFEILLRGQQWRRGGGSRNSRGLLVVLHRRSGLDFVLVPGGKPDMGLTGARRAKSDRRVWVEPFLLCATPCTQQAWDRVGGEDRRRFRGPQLPIEGVSFLDAQAWCERAGGGLRLPFEAEWEYACRAGAETAFCFGDEPGGLGAYGWSREISGGRTHPVASRRPNDWGIFDLHGNVWEWCADAWDEGGADPSDAVDRVGRGGSWRVSAHDCRCGHRSRGAPSARGGALGFRPAASLP